MLVDDEGSKESPTYIGRLNVPIKSINLGKLYVNAHA